MPNHPRVMRSSSLSKESYLIAKQNRKFYAMNNGEIIRSKEFFT
jgi:hypothetical protein